jgi:hypothetical protein
MSPAKKQNADILADPQSFRLAVARAREAFGKIPGVVSVGMGQKETGSRYKDDIAIVVFVRVKKNEKDLPLQERIPASFEGYPTDVRIVHKAAFHACDNTATFDTIEGGIQITGPMNETTGLFHMGTLGAIVKRRNNSSRENVYLLTNKHVLFIDASKAGEYVYHPFCPTPDSKKFVAPGASRALGPIQDGPFLSNVDFVDPNTSTHIQVFIDCALARIDIDSKCLGTTCTQDVIKTAQEIIELQLNGVNTIKDVRSVIGDPSIIGQKVYKVGRTTGRTVGIVRYTDAPVDVPPDPAISGSTGFSGQNTIQIDFDTTSATGGVNCKGNARFTEEGDSGALVLDDQGRAIGLHSLGAPAGSPSAFPANACHILPVLDQLNICIPTPAGTSRGSCSATDGSGVDPAPLGDFPLPDGTVDFASENVAAPMATVAPPTAGEMDHLRELLASFRSTSFGRELHEVFGHIRREIGYLVRNCRPVKVVWARNKGPAFFAHLLNHLKGTTQAVPREIDGITRAALFAQILPALSAHGSIPLRRAIAEHGKKLALMAAEKDTIQDCISYMHERESA